MPRRLTHKEAAQRTAGLAAMLQAERTRRGLSQRDAAFEMDVNPSTICRFEKGLLPDVPNFLIVLEWLGVPLAALLGARHDATFDAYQRGRDDVTALVRAALGGGDN